MIAGTTNTEILKKEFGPKEQNKSIIMKVQQVYDLRKVRSGDLMKLILVNYDGASVQLNAWHENARKMASSFMIEAGEIYNFTGLKVLKRSDVADEHGRAYNTTTLPYELETTSLTLCTRVPDTSKPPTLDFTRMVVAVGYEFGPFSKFVIYVACNTFC